MNKEFKLHLNAGDYAFDHIDSNKTYNGFDVYKMLYDAYIAGNNDTLDDEDERIKGAIIHFISHTPTIPKGIIGKKTMIAWLKKQGEQKLADTVEPKFQEGDWVISNLDGKTRQISEVHFDKYNSYYVVNGKSVNLEEYDRLHHLWTIKDAKDGDVLATSAGAFIYNGNNGGGSCPGCYCGINTLGRFQTGVEHHWTGKKAYPSTEEQRTELFLKMHEAGYEWDANKKELKKIEQKQTDKVKSKFKIGDWLIFNESHNSVYQVERINNYRYYLRHYLGSTMSAHFDNELIRVWTIQDAKDGDVLATDNGNIYIFDGTFKDDKYPFAYCGFTRHRFEIYDRRLPFTHNNIYPATKEQRDLLFQKMKEAGYEWDDNKKELKKIEQKQTDKVKPKFKIGAWVINRTNAIIMQIVNNKDFYESIEIDGHRRTDSYNYADWDFRLWTIQDAKDGDVLVSNYGTFILMGKSNGGYCGVLNDNTFIRSTGNNEWTKDLHPATKEQRDLLFQKMKEAGYEWDIENKKLKKIEQKSDNKIKPIFNVGDKIQYSKGCGTIMTIEKIENGEYIFGNNMGHTTIENGNKCYLVEKKSDKWTKEDDERLGSCIFCTQSFAVENHIDSANTAWLKSLKQRIMKGE